MLWCIQQTQFFNLWRFSKTGMRRAPKLVLIGEILLFIVYYFLLGNIGNLQSVGNYIVSSIIALVLSLPLGFLLGVVAYYFKLLLTKRSTATSSPPVRAAHWTRSETWKTLGIGLFILPAVALAVFILVDWSFFEQVVVVILEVIFGLAVILGMGKQTPEERARAKKRGQLEREAVAYHNVPSKDWPLRLEKTQAYEERTWKEKRGRT